MGSVYFQIKSVLLHFGIEQFGQGVRSWLIGSIVAFYRIAAGCITHHVHRVHGNDFAVARIADAGLLHSIAYGAL